MVGGLWGAIDKKGEVVVPLKYDSEGEVKKELTFISLFPSLGGEKI